MKHLLIGVVAAATLAISQPVWAQQAAPAARLRPPAPRQCRLSMSAPRRVPITGVTRSRRRGIHLPAALPTS
jgi:hypothetical protein